jgi:8-oxo-dGTP pyrophosphatase MutT (NUDIX family)
MSWRRLRGGIAYRAWQAQQHPDVLFGAGVFLFSTVGAGMTHVLPSLATALFLANVVVVGGGLWTLVRSGADRRVLAPAHDDWSELRTDPPGAELRHSSDASKSAVVWPRVDTRLWRSDSRVEQLAPFKLDAQARAVSIAALRHHRAGAALLFNDEKVRLASRLTPERLEAGAAIAVQRTDYFSSLVTNELTGRQVVRAEQNRDVAYDGRSFFVSGATLLPHETSRCSDHIGISAHAITIDGMLISTLQAPRSAHDPGRFATAGSGSIDWAELGASDQRFIELVAAAMRREVHEECGCSLEEVSVPLVTGYARLLHRGGKPEFFGLCVLNMHSRDLTVRRSERPFVDGHRFHPIDRTSVTAFLASLLDVGDQLGGLQSLQWALSTEAAARHARTGLVSQLLGDLSGEPSRPRL